MVRKDSVPAVAILGAAICVRRFSEPLRALALRFAQNSRKSCDPRRQRRP